MPRFFNKVLLGAALIAPLAVVPAALRADDRKYHDEGHHDEHVWNSHEDKAYRIYLKENHRKYRNFEVLKENEREDYWRWRHDHDDTLLKINIR